MLVEELIKKLQDCDPKDIVVLSSDPEGNEFAQVADIEEYQYDIDTNIIGIRVLTEDLCREGCTEADLLENGVNCIVLWP